MKSLIGTLAAVVHWEVQHVHRHLMPKSFGEVTILSFQRQADDRFADQEPTPIERRGGDGAPTTDALRQQWNAL